MEERCAAKIYLEAVNADATPSPWAVSWIGLSLKGYGIHGTSNPRSIGRRASHGCIRLRNADVEELFGLVAVGDAVELRAGP